MVMWFWLPDFSSLGAGCFYCVLWPKGGPDGPSRSAGLRQCSVNGFAHSVHTATESTEGFLEKSLGLYTSCCPGSICAVHMHAKHTSLESHAPCARISHAQTREYRTLNIKAWPRKGLVRHPSLTCKAIGLMAPKGVSQRTLLAREERHHESTVVLSTVPQWTTSKVITTHSSF